MALFVIRLGGRAAATREGTPDPAAQRDRAPRSNSVRADRAARRPLGTEGATFPVVSAAPDSAAPSLLDSEGSNEAPTCCRARCRPAAGRDTTRRHWRQAGSGSQDAAVRPMPDPAAAGCRHRVYGVADSECMGGNGAVVTSAPLSAASGRRRPH